MSSHDIVSMSHSISEGGSSSSSSSSSSSRSSIGRKDPPKSPSKSTSAPSPKQTRFKDQEKEEKEAEEVLAAQLWKKIDSYMESEYLGPALTNLHPPSRSASYPVVKAFLETINQKLFANYKRAFVNKMFTQGLVLTERAAVLFLQWDHLSGCAAEMLNDPEQFQPELEEIAIELSDGWIPSAKTRLMFKVISAFLEIEESRRPRNSNHPVSSVEEKGKGKDEREFTERLSSNFDRSEEAVRKEQRRVERGSKSYWGGRGGRGDQHAGTSSLLTDEEDGIPEEVGIFDTS